jgi:hypothetical protein
MRTELLNNIQTNFRLGRVHITYPIATRAEPVPKHGNIRPNNTSCISSLLSENTRFEVRDNRRVARAQGQGTRNI